MLESVPVALAVGTVLGVLSGLGIGGGSLLILWLTMVLEMDYDTAREINLLFFLPAASIACVYRWKQGQVNVPVVVPAIVGGCLTAVLLAQASAGWDLHVVKKLFGVLLLITGLRECFYRPKKSG